MALLVSQLARPPFGGITLQAFDYIRAQTAAEVVTLLSPQARTVRILNGGTDLLVQLREGRRQADRLVDIKQVPEANELSYDPIDGLRLGAAVPCYRLCDDLLVPRVYPGLIDAVSLIGGTQIQGRATVGGNLCNASPAADSIPALIVHQAVCIMAGPGGRREVPIENFCLAPGETVLQHGEFLVALRVPPPDRRFGAAYLRFIPRNEMDIAVVGAGAAVLLDESRSTIISVRIALGAVAPTPLLAREAGEYLAGKPVSAETLVEAARLAQGAARPITDMRGTIAQRKHLARVLTRRALEKAIERARA
jgi:carbon-monoxide dehydrogenase medium subunit